MIDLVIFEWFVDLITQGNPQRFDAMAALAIVLLVTALLLVSAVQELKKRDVIADGDAGVWSARLTAAVGTLVTIVQFFRPDFDVTGTAEVIQLLVSGGAFVIAQVAANWSVYTGGRFIGIFRDLFAGDDPGPDDKEGKMLDLRAQLEALRDDVNQARKAA